MSTTKVYQLPTATSVQGVDLLHLNQNSQDFQISIDDLSEKFGEVNIYDLQEIITPVAAQWLAIADSSGDISTNRRVSIANLSGLLQKEQFYDTSSAVALTDEVVFRQANAPTLTQITVEGIRDRVTDLTDNMLAIPSVAVGDRFSIYDISEGKHRYIRKDTLQQVIGNPTSLNTLTDVASNDSLLIWDDSASQVKRVEQSNLLDIDSGELVQTTSDLSIYYRYTRIFDVVTLSGYADFASDAVTRTVTFPLTIPQFPNVPAAGATEAFTTSVNITARKTGSESNAQGTKIAVSDVTATACTVRLWGETATSTHRGFYFTVTYKTSA